MRPPRTEGCSMKGANCGFRALLSEQKYPARTFLSKNPLSLPFPVSG